MALSITSPYQVYFLKYKYIQQLYNAKNILAVARNFCAIYKDPIQANQRSMAFYGTLPWIGVGSNAGGIQAHQPPTTFYGTLPWIRVQ